MLVLLHITSGTNSFRLRWRAKTCLTQLLLPSGWGRRRGLVCNITPRHDVGGSPYSGPILATLQRRPRLVSAARGMSVGVVDTEGGDTLHTVSYGGGEQGVRRMLVSRGEMRKRASAGRVRVRVGGSSFPYAPQRALCRYNCPPLAAYCCRALTMDGDSPAGNNEQERSPHVARFAIPLPGASFHQIGRRTEIGPSNSESDRLDPLFYSAFSCSCLSISSLTNPTYLLVVAMFACPRAVWTTFRSVFFRT